ncbi:MAG: InlB B-repeat-containing protein [Spirochaetaceae bacterium]|nr:InlB B-repeat-containing protein [Spirochaetaceae bacterium]
MMFSRRFNSSTAYIISFWAKADTERTQTLCIRNYDDELELLSPTIDLTTEYKKYTYQFYLTSEDLNEEIEFQFRLNQGDTYIKDCYITPMWIEKNGIWEKKADFPQWSIWSDTSCRTYPANWIVLQDMAEDSIKVQRFIGTREDSWNNWKLQFGYEKEIPESGKYVFSFTDEKGLTGCINLRNSTTDKDVNKYSDLSGLGGNYYIIFDVTEAEVNNMFTLAFWTKDMELTDGIEYIHLSNVKLEKYDSNKTYSGKNLGQKQSLIYFESERGKLENWDSMYMYVDIGSQIETFPTLIYEGTDYTFAGWYTDSEFNNLMTFPYTVTENNLTVYAKWIPNVSNVNQFKGTWHGSYDGNSHWYLIFSDDTMTFYAGELDGISPYTYSGNSATLTEDSWTYDLEIKADGTINYEDTNFSRVEENVENDPFTGVWITYSEKYYTGFMVLQASNGTAFQVIDGEIETSDLTYTVSENIVTINDSVQFEISGNSFNLNGDTFYRAYDVDFSKIDEFWPTTVIDETNFISSDSSVTVTKSDTEVLIENPNAETANSEWDYYVTATEEFEMSANQNYKVSVEVKSDSEKDVIFRLADYLRTESHVQVKKTINTEWQTIEFEAGSWQGDWLAQFIVYVGTTDVVYLRNLKVEGVNTNLLPVTEYNNSVISNRTENGFTVEIRDTSEWIKISGQKAELGNLYKITFDASATETTNLNFVARASQEKFSKSWNHQEISSTPTNFSLYVPHVGTDNSTEYDFMDIGFSSSAISTITISNFTVEIVGSEEKPDVLFALQGENDYWNQFMGYLGSGQDITIPAGESYEIFAQIGAENFDHDWSNVVELRYVTGSEILDISTNKDGRSVITNNTVIDREFKLWIYHDYRIIVEELPTYSVTFDLNDGTFNGSSSNVTLDVSNLLAVKPEKEGYTFVGWTLTENGDDFISSVDSECTVYAKWQDNLLLFANGDIIGDFSVTASETDAGTYVYDETVTLNLIYEDNGVYTTTFAYQDYMNGWGSQSGTCAFKLRTSAGSWDGTSYGIADPANQPIIGGDAVLIDAVQGDNIVVTGLVSGTTYKITVTCSQDGTVTLKVDAL